MKFWQILACLSEEQYIIEKHFPDYKFIKGTSEVDESLVLKAFSESSMNFCISKNNGSKTLRFLPVSSYFLEKGISVSESGISIKEAYIKFGGDIITEVIDYGSCELPATIF